MIEGQVQREIRECLSAGRVSFSEGSYYFDGTITVNKDGIDFKSIGRGLVWYNGLNWTVIGV